MPGSLNGLHTGLQHVCSAAAGRLEDVVVVGGRYPGRVKMGMVQKGLRRRNSGQGDVERNGDQVAVADKQGAGVGFKRQLHVPGVVRIFCVIVEVMLPHKAEKRKILVKFTMFPEMFHEHRQLHQLAQFCFCEQQQGEKQYGGDPSH